MLNNKLIAVVVPAYNEETQIMKVTENLPEFIDKIVVINDCSKDKTGEVIEKLALSNPRIVPIHHNINRGVGGAIATGYVWSRDHDIDVAVVMAGDGQMDPADLPAILEPVVNGEVDYSKGNRLFTGEAYRKIPKARYFGNSVLSLLTKIASGYWHIADSQTGYTAINKKALHLIDWNQMYTRYGQPNDLLVRLNVFNMKVRDIPIKPVYNVGEKSGIKIRKVVFTISYLLLKKFLWRMKEKYIIRDFHPLIFFYIMGFFFFLLTIVLSIRLVYFLVTTGSLPPINTLTMLFSFMSSTLFTLFAMWFDMESNKDLK
ncbi:MAG: glycosyltransferase family 2 protein [Chitinophagales bacterium]|nr:glycosyltransferase family 2 protein [Chitinophagales bacterium]